MGHPTTSVPTTDVPPPPLPHRRPLAAVGGRTFTDDRGERLERTPERIVGHVGSAAALHDHGVEPDLRAGTPDVDRLTVLGNACASPVR